MPVTAQAGKMSWALMRHPKGLDCDLFISHAWQEGVFEFLSKVLHSWPAGARHVWCCMLANPQHLDISSLLQSPSSSPFALALQASTCVLVVPNRHCSIYTRLWCGYEAYRAHEEGKTILIARASNSQQIGQALVETGLAGLVGTVAGTLFQSAMFHPVPVCVTAVAGALSANMKHNGWRMVLNWVGAFTCGVIFVHWRTLHFQQGEDTADTVPAIFSFVEQHLLVLAGMTFFLLLEVDRVNGKARLEEAEQLRHGFQGSIAHATCSEEADAIRIFGEIGEKTGAVDYAIDVLLAAGMSSPTLRETARKGIDVGGAGSAEIAFPFVALVPLSIETIWSIYVDFIYLHDHVHLWSIPLWLFQTMTVVTRVGVLLRLWRSPEDERCFILKMMAKIVALYMLIICPLLAMWELRAGGTFAPDSGWFALPFVVYTSILAFACLGMQRLGTIPVLGPCLLQLFLARGHTAFASALPSRPRSWSMEWMEAETASDTDSPRSSASSSL
ncbi:unnamed protein product [Symbiodinium natans]|uniref:Uncharacterized protein n=1 Tax=Symbiodinium natans TaxID=878477 RepID=A0A812JBA0_9DINO|nr:unnamed protein product [Symbiodinium natans]